MVFRRNPLQEVMAGLGDPPLSLKILLGTLAFGCLADAVEPLRAWVDWLRLDSAVWESGQLWRLVTYGLFGRGGIRAWSIVQLILVYWLGQQMVVWLGERRTRIVILGGIAVSGTTAVLVQFVSNVIGGPSCDYAPFWLLQGQNVVIAIGLAVFAVSNRYSTVSHTPYLFGIAIPTRWLVPLQLLMAVGGALGTGDVGGLAGIVAATAWGWRSPDQRRTGFRGRRHGRGV